MEDEADKFLGSIYCAVISRALYHFKALEEAEEQVNQNYYKITDYAFHLRSFIEIITALPLWFKHPYYTADMPIEALHDFMDNFVWAKNRQEKGIEVMGIKDIKELSAKLESFSSTVPSDRYTVELGNVKQQRGKDPFYAEGFKYLSKIIHSDEFSVMLTSDLLEETLSREKIIGFLKHLKAFWLKEFHFQLYSFHADRNEANIDITNICKLPFDINENPYAEKREG